MTHSNEEKPRENGYCGNLRPPKLICFGNPLLDICFKTSDDIVLKKHKLNPNEQKEVSIEQLKQLIDDAKKRYKNSSFSLGGSSLNTCRILKSLGEDTFLFFGSVGQDQNGTKIKEILEKDNIRSCLQTFDEHSTGTCVCLIKDDCRSLTANIGAALHLQLEHVIDNLEKFENLKPEGSHSTQKQRIERLGTIFYVEGFFIPEKMHICRYLYENYCQDSSNLLITNLNAPYIVQNYTKDVQYMAGCADILFGNRDEFEELASILGLKSIEDLITNFLTEYSKGNRKKAIIITDGSNPVLIYEGNKNSEIQSDFYNVPEVNSADIVDTTGAGDSFVAGFIFAFLQKKTILECVSFGCEISSRVIKVVGCNLPN